MSKYILIILSVILWSCNKETPGCTDISACNYNADATEDDGSCAYPGDSCSDPILGAGAGSLSGSGSSQWHSVELAAGLLSARFDVCDAGCDTKMMIVDDCANADCSPSWSNNYGADCGAVGYNDDDYTYCGSTASSINLDTPDAGTYYVKVYPYSSCANDYTLNVTTVEGIYGCADVNADNFSFTKDSMTWKVGDNRDTRFEIDAKTIQNARKKGMISYGSCSFQEPIDDLSQLGWM